MLSTDIVMVQLLKLVNYCEHNITNYAMSIIYI